MASASLIPSFCHTILFLFLFIIISHPPSVTSQVPLYPSPSIAQCTSSLLPLLPCAPFVQGLAESPGQPCCDNLKQLYTQIPHCLCLLLNDTTSTSFPINTTLALQLPALCALPLNISDCPGVKLPPTSPDSQVSFGTMGNPTVAASPVVPVTPKPSIIGFGHGRSSDATNFKARGGFAVAMTLAILSLA